MRRAGGLAALVVAATLLTGCTDEEGPKADVVGSAVFDGEVVTVGDGDGIVETTVEGSHLYRGDTRVAVQALIVDGPVMELRVALTPLGGNGADPDELVSIYDMQDRPPLVSDVASLRQHEVVGRWTTDVVQAETVEGRPLLYQAWYAAPSQRVEVLDVVMGAEGPTFRDVPVTYR